MNPDPAQLLRPDAVVAARVMAAAFVSDPLWMHRYQDTEKRRIVLRRFFNAFVRTAIDRGEAFGVGVPLDGVAVWRGPDERRQVSPTTLARWLPLVASSFPVKAVSVRVVFTECAAMHRRRAPGPHYFLETIGIRPGAAGHRCGRQAHPASTPDRR